MLDRRSGVRNTQHTLPGGLELHDLFRALGLETPVAHGEDFVDDQEIRVYVDRHRKRQAHHHAGRISPQRFVNKVADAGELNNGREQIARLLAG